MTVINHYQRSIYFCVILVLICFNAFAQVEEPASDIESTETIETHIPWLNLPQAIAANKDSVYGTVGIIRTEYQPISRFDRIITYLSRKTGFCSNFDIRTGFVGPNNKTLITSSNILLDNQGTYLHNTYTWHLQHDDKKAPEASQGIPLRNFVILSQHKGYAEGLEKEESTQSNIAIAVAAEQLCENHLPTINFEHNQKLFWSDTPKCVIGYSSEMYSDLLKAPEAEERYRLHQSALTRAPTQATSWYALEYLDFQNCHTLNQPFVYGFSSTMGSPVFIEAPGRGLLICGLLVNSTAPKLSKDNTQSGQTFIHYFTPQDKELLDNYQPHILSLSETLDNAPPQVESLQSKQIVHYESVRNVQVSRDNELLQPQVTWAELEHASDYVIFRTEAPLLSGKAEEFMASVNHTQFVDTTADIFKTYYYWVCAHFVDPHELLTYPSGPHKLVATPTPEAPEVTASTEKPYTFLWKPATQGTQLTSYKVYRRTIGSLEDTEHPTETAIDVDAQKKAESPKLVVMETMEPNFTDVTAKTNEQYVYWVTTQLHTSESQPSKEIEVDFIRKPTQAPENIRVHAWVPHRLTWDPLPEAFMSYFVYAAPENNIHGSDLKFLGETRDAYLSIDPEIAQQYNFYTVFAVNPAALGPYAGRFTELSFKPSPLEAPKHPKVLNPLKRRLSWELPPNVYVTHYNIYRKEKGSHEEAALLARTEDNIFEDKSAKNGITYLYQIQAFKGEEQSPLSQELEVCFDCSP